MLNKPLRKELARKQEVLNVADRQDDDIHQTTNGNNQENINDNPYP